MINFDTVKYVNNRKSENKTVCYFIDNTKLIFENEFYEDLNKMMNFKGVSEQ